jgi:hypothetical protein
LRIRQRGIEADRDLVLLARDDVERRLAEHVLVAPELLAVQEHRGVRVEAVEDEPQPLARGGLEAQPVPPLALLDPAAGVLVAVIERMLDPAGLDQRAMQVARHGDLDPPLAAEVLHAALAGREVAREGGADERACRRDRHHFTPPAVRPPTM